MNMTRDRVQSLAWALIVSVSFALLLALTFRVNAVKSEVQLMDRKILQVKRDRIRLETEFQTRSNQTQIAELNTVRLGMESPRAGQYIGGEVQLASLSKPVMPVAAAPIMLASAEVPVGTRPAATGSVVAAVFTKASSKSLGEGSATRMLAQHGEKVAPGGKDRLERTLTLASAQSASAQSAHAQFARAQSAHAPIGRARHAPAAAPLAASPDFLAAATGNDRLRTTAGSVSGRPAALASSRPAKKAATVADAFGGDWMRQIPAGRSKSRAGQ